VKQRQTYSRKLILTILDHQQLPFCFSQRIFLELLQVGPHPPMINFHKFLEQGIKRIDALPFAEKCQNTEGF